MKAALIGLLVVVVVAAAGGAYLLFRPDGGSSTTEYAKQLDALCRDARKQTEALGQPSTAPISKLYPGSVRIGRAFLVEATKLQPPPEQAAAAKTFLTQRGLYYDGLEYAYQFLTGQQNQVAFVRIVNGALANLDQAETAAKAIGAEECTLRPFE
jgi:hypothetical protein